jgi:uncharacterized RmlC-like cupin family protein
VTDLAAAVTGVALVDLDAGELRAAFGQHPLRLRHALTGHPALSLDALARVAAAHPAELVEHHRADLPLLLPTGEAEALPLPAGDVVTGIRDNGCWVVLWCLERAAGYRGLVDGSIAPVRAIVPASEGRLGPTDGLALVASPGAVVPAHLDNNHNVLFQVEGTKELFVGEFLDAREQHRQVERRYGPSGLNHDRLPDVVTRHELRPGDAIYLPPFTTHWVVGGSDVSVALSCSFTTAASRRAQQVHAYNARLRRLGLDPRPPGSDARRDGAKVAALRAWLRARTLRDRISRLRSRTGAAPAPA